MIIIADKKTCNFDIHYNFNHCVQYTRISYTLPLMWLPNSDYRTCTKHAGETVMVNKFPKEQSNDNNFVSTYTPGPDL